MRTGLDSAKWPVTKWRDITVTCYMFGPLFFLIPLLSSDRSALKRHGSTHLNGRNKGKIQRTEQSTVSANTDHHSNTALHPDTGKSLSKYLYDPSGQPSTNDNFLQISLSSLLPHSSPGPNNIMPLYPTGQPSIVEQLDHISALICVKTLQVRIN